MVSRRVLNTYQQAGQSVITLLIFMIIGVTITTAGVMMIITSSTATSATQESTIAYYAAESGAENALLRLLRNPTYTGETLQLGNANVAITISGTGPYTIESTAVNGNFTRTIQVTVAYLNNILTVTSWQEIL